MPARSTALMCTNTSFPPSSGWMNPNPFWLLNHFTVLCVISLLFRYCACGAAPGGRLRSVRVLEEGRQSDALVAARPSRSAEARSRKCTPWRPVPQGRELANRAGDQEPVSEKAQGISGSLKRSHFLRTEALLLDLEILDPLKPTL